MRQSNQFVSQSYRILHGDLIDISPCYMVRLFILIVTLSFNKYAVGGGPEAFLCEGHCRSNGDLISWFILLIVVAVPLAAIFLGWKILERKSLHLIYLPAIVGWLILVLFDIQAKNYLYTLAVSFWLGLLLIWLATTFFNISYYDKFHEAEKRNHKRDDANLNQNSKTTFWTPVDVIAAKSTGAEKLSSNVANPPVDTLVDNPNDPYRIYRIENWSNSTLLAALDNPGYKAPNYKNTLIKIHAELTKRGVTLNKDN